ncbi:large ribosomal subunit protein mL41 [Misgurnus anguillicaudatus]|uniref:large ribosomal subunit protein mL41 n=1 Tax=Misgurnus anguillicaudatus TaxID=75329 RepID=UPI003CCF057B
MGVLSTLTRGLVRGADRMSEFTSKRGPNTFYKSRGARPTGVLTSSRKFIPVRAMIPEFVVPNLEGFNLKPYVSYKAPEGTEQPMTAESLFSQVVAPQIERDIEEGVFNKDNLEKYGLEKTQDGKLFKLYPKYFAR